MIILAYLFELVINIKLLVQIKEKKVVIVASLQNKLKRHERREVAVLMEKKKKRFRCKLVVQQTFSEFVHNSVCCVKHIDQNSDLCETHIKNFNVNV